ncbi:hypothetical protein MMC24_006819 [Lignoscripta atroalba]|nr:hypothetical protein [Lignoscripta atroalba]
MEVIPVVRKRGRPKKTESLLQDEVPLSPDKSKRKKSTTTNPQTAGKPSPRVQEAIDHSKMAADALPQQPQRPATAKFTAPISATPPSKILQQVAEIQKSAATPPQLSPTPIIETPKDKPPTSPTTPAPEPLTTTISSFPPPPPPPAAAQPAAVPPPPQPTTPTSTSTPTSTPNPNPTTHSPFPSPTSLNAFAVSQLSGRPSRPTPRIYDGRLPDKYKPAARRITFVMVALPIAIVTSWVLWQRLVLGEERKRLVRPEEERRASVEST